MADDDTPDQTSISLPSLALFLALLFFTARYFLRPSTSQASSGQGQGPTRAARSPPVDRAKVNQVLAMFPQLDRRAIAWDLARNGGSVARTAERALAGSGLEVPPQSFQPPNLDDAPSAGVSSGTSGASGASTGASPAASIAQKDLISRYNLSGKLGKQPEVHAESATDEDHGKRPEIRKSTGWASTKSERANLLAARRDEMILKARRAMEAKVRAEEGKGA